LIEKTFNLNRNSKNETTNQNKNTNIYDPSSKTMLQRYLSQKKGDKYNIKLASFLHFLLLKMGYYQVLLCLIIFAISKPTFSNIYMQNPRYNNLYEDEL